MDIEKAAMMDGQTERKKGAAAAACSATGWVASMDEF